MDQASSRGARPGASVGRGRRGALAPFAAASSKVPATEGEAAPGSDMAGAGRGATKKPDTPEDAWPVARDEATARGVEACRLAACATTELEVATHGRHTAMAALVDGPIGVAREVPPFREGSLWRRPP